MIKKYTYPVSLILACLSLAITSTLFVRQFSTIKSHNQPHDHQSQKSPLIVENIQTWMTFEYLNRSFSIPNEYLKNNLQITSTAYPKITIAKASLLSSTSTLDFLNAVKAAVEQYNQQDSQKK